MSHSSGFDIAVYYEDGYVKKIHTWAVPGTIGLGSLYEMMFGLVAKCGWSITNYAALCVDKN